MGAVIRIHEKEIRNRLEESYNPETPRYFKVCKIGLIRIPVGGCELEDEYEVSLIGGKYFNHSHCVWFRTIDITIAAATTTELYNLATI